MNKSITNILSVIIGVGLFIAYRIGINVGAKWAYILLIVLSLLVATMNKFTFTIVVKFLATIDILYSIAMLIPADIMKSAIKILNANGNNIIIIITIFNVVGRVMVVASSLVVLLFGVLVGTFYREILITLLGIPFKIFRPIPNVNNLVRRETSIYFYKGSSNKCIQLIYRKGKKKCILDTYQYDDELLQPYLSLEWEGQKCVKVSKYHALTHRKIEEKIYEI